MKKPKKKESDLSTFSDNSLEDWANEEITPPEDVIDEMEYRHLDR
uniref:Uncharacterized protein n=1 Tax=viral metagenome TaxID=1070528 RepID=A0A6M3JP62_9ZZZZ